MIRERFENWLDRIRRELKEARAGIDPAVTESAMREQRRCLGVLKCSYVGVLKRVCVPCCYLFAVNGAITEEYGLLYSWGALTVVLLVAVRGLEKITDSFDDDDPFIRPAVPVEF